MDRVTRSRDPDRARPELAILDCATAVTFRGLITNRSIVRRSRRKSLILKRRDVRVVEGARLESEAVELHRVMPKHLFTQLIQRLPATDAS